jgi:aminoglycoside adenylyltransferase-like protein/nucleotidyltransferase-like protein
MADNRDPAASPWQLTPYPEVNTGAQELLTSISAVLGAQFVGMYLLGSLALGDFHPESSDLDLLIVTTAALADETVAALRELHQRFDRTTSPWARRIDAVYLPQGALREPVPSAARFPTVEWPGLLALEPPEPGWPIQRYTLREHGVVVSGPDPRSLLDPVHPDELRQASMDRVEEWQARAQRDPDGVAWLRVQSNHAFVALTLCRVLYTLHTGSVASKPAAARWAEGTLTGRFSALIRRATGQERTTEVVSDDELHETLAFLAYTNRLYQLWHGSLTAEKQEE